MVLKYSRKRKSVYMFYFNCTKGDLKICNCCLYIGSLLLINLYCTPNGMKSAGSWPFLEQPADGSASVPNTGAPSLASAKRLQEHVAGGQCNLSPAKSHLQFP